MTNDKQRERLVELLQGAYDKYINLLEFEKNIIATHLIENALIVPPCNIGDTVYQTNGTTIKEYKVDYFDIFKNSVNFTFKIHLIADNWSDFVFDDDFGKTVFLTKKEAEEALKGGEENG